MEKSLTLGEAIDDFAANVVPNLFPGKKKDNKSYYRIKNLLYARKAELAGKAHKRLITARWAEKIFKDFAPGRYRIEHHAVFYLNEPEP